MYLRFVLGVHAVPGRLCIYLLHGCVTESHWIEKPARGGHICGTQFGGLGVQSAIVGCSLVCGSRIDCKRCRNTIGNVFANSIGRIHATGSGIRTEMR